MTAHPSLAIPVLQSSLYCLHFLSTHSKNPNTNHSTTTKPAIEPDPFATLNTVNHSDF